MAGITATEARSNLYRLIDTVAGQFLLACALIS